jgi:hypothetical protein
MIGVLELILDISLKSWLESILKIEIGRKNKFGVQVSQ